LHEVAAGWTANEVLVVRISQIEARLLALDGIVDIGRVTLNGAAENLLLNEDNVPVRGEMDVRIG
ncbi:MAG: phage tail protein, partial [Firmicutes bacterium]|nr:phage tail protein [Bacillota bacterium]